MATYTIKVQIDKSWVGRFNESGTKLCFAHGVSDSSATEKLSFNVVSSAEKVAENVSLTWTDTYTIAGGSQSFKNGTAISITTTPEKIEFKQSVLLTEAFLLVPAKPDPKLGDGEFAFINKTAASAYLYKQIPDEKDPEQKVATPFYISQSGPNPPGTSTLTPKPVTRLFFAKHYESGTMVDDFQSETIDVDLTKKTTATIQYNDKGHWIELQ
ncbi:uncharacterized protein PG998_005968 [Apiospora kogelbergensis]|uniref:uncharacterized protein n=1 Tax=Apiospora kogelbergensis TaxID=1337665 RepID=UPI003130E07E